MWSGFLLLGFLTVLAFVAALAVAVRARLAGRAEVALATLVTWNALILTPIYVLGLTNHLYASTLAWTSGAFFAAVLACTFAFARTEPRRHVADVGRALGDIVRLPFDALRFAWRARSLVLVALVFAFGIIVWTAIESYYAPTWHGWDALWYHEPIIGLTIQNHGFAMADVPAGMQKINGYPRACEMTALWFGIFVGRRLIDIVGSLVAPGLMLGVYLIARRSNPDRVVAMGWGAATLLMPACTNILQSTYVDLHFAVLLVAAIHFATRMEMRLRDAWLAAMALALAVGGKAHALVPVPILALIVVVRLIPQMRKGGRHALATSATIAGGAALIFAMAGAIYLRNYLHFHNPLWPELKYDNDKLGIHWPGAMTFGDTGGKNTDGNLNMNLPWGQLVEDLFSIPFSWHRWHYGEIHEYGFYVAWLVIPLSILCFGGLVFALVRSAVGRVVGRPDWRASRETTNMALVCLPMVATLYASPALWAARYHIAVVGVMMALLGWAGGRRGWTLLAQGAVAVCSIGAVVTFFWASPRVWYTPQELMKVVRVAYPERELVTAAMVNPDLHFTVGSPTNHDVGLARERELTRGTVLVYEDDFGAYPALFWNDRYDNRAVYVPSGPSWLARAMEQNPTWIFASTSSETYRLLSGHASGWELVGILNVENWGAVFRRKK